MTVLSPTATLRGETARSLNGGAKTRQGAATRLAVRGSGGGCAQVAIAMQGSMLARGRGEGAAPAPAAAAAATIASPALHRPDTPE